MMTVYRFDEEETKEVFEVMREQIRYNANHNKGQKPWPLYDRLAKYFGRNSSQTEYEYWRDVYEDEKRSAIEDAINADKESEEDEDTEDEE